MAKFEINRLSLILVALAIIAALGLLSSIVTQGFAELATAREEKRRLEAERARLTQRIEDLSATIEAVGSDPETVESIARYELGWIGPGEEIVVLEPPPPPPPLEDLTDSETDPILRLP